MLPAGIVGVGDGSDVGVNVAVAVGGWVAGSVTVGFGCAVLVLGSTLAHAARIKQSIIKEISFFNSNLS